MNSPNCRPLSFVFRTISTRSVFVLGILMFFAGLAPSLAQFETASVLGYVRDSSGAAVAQAQVSLVNLATGRNGDREDRQKWRV